MTTYSGTIYRSAAPSATTGPTLADLTDAGRQLDEILSTRGETT